MTRLITISGEPGCGKSTVARMVAETLGFDYLSAGSIQREVAAKLGLTTLELNLRAEADAAIDAEIDANTRALTLSGRRVVVDSRMAWHFLPDSMKVFLRCPPAVAAARVLQQGRAEERYDNEAQAAESLVLRYESEKARFTKYYGVDLGDLRNFHLVIDTSAAPAKAIANAIYELARSQ